jgi:hypothetical protein
MASKPAEQLVLQREAFKVLGINPAHKAILCLDGGGIRGIMTIQLLKRIEELTGKACHQIFDMVAGTSTGGIIAGLVASGKTASEIEALYDTFVRRVFRARIGGHQLLNPPKWTKADYRARLFEELGNKTLAQACEQNQIDLLITSHDVAEGEETFFSYLRGRTEQKNTYGSVPLRTVMEATMSAPTYFFPMERFVDGGVTTFNDPSLAAMMEAVEYGPEANDYQSDQITLMSFGTGCRTQFIEPANTADPPGLDSKFWLTWLMTESGNDSADMQSYLFRARKILRVDYRRFQISLDRKAVELIPDREISAPNVTRARTLHALDNRELSAIEMDNVDYFPVMKAIGQSMAEFICSTDSGNNCFMRDLTRPGKRSDWLVTRSGRPEDLKLMLSNPAWIDTVQDV